MTHSPRPSDARRPLLSVRQAGHGETVVLIHGLGATQQIWNLVRAPLAARRRVVTIDLPGFGRSAPAGEGYDLEAVAERVARGLSAHRVRAPFDLVGHSLGGGVALTLAAARPTLVCRLVLVAPAGLRPAPLRSAGLLSAGVEEMFSARRRLAPLTDLRWWRRLLLSFAACDGASISPAQARAMVEASTGATRIRSAFGSIAAADLRPLLAATPAPLGLIWGERDRTVPPRIAREVRSARPDAALELIPGAGHVPMVERPHAFAAALERLLATLSKQATTRHGRTSILR